MKCPRCGCRGHYVYNWWCEDCFAHRQNGYPNPIVFDVLMLQSPRLADLVEIVDRGRSRHTVWKILIDEDA